jgi:two-component system, cell cycle response regulator
MAARVLVIEDNVTNLDLMSYLLRAFGHQALRATAGAAGVEAAARERPDLIVCDLQMPGADGFEVLRRLHADPATSSIPVVAVTAYAMVGDRERILAAGFDGYIAKPIEPQSFVPQLETYLARSLHGGRSNSGTPRESAVRAAEAREPRATVLAVDNSPPNLQLVRAVLEPAGFRVVEARSVEEALALLGSETPGLILSDIHMPGADGWSLLERVKADAALAVIPFVFLSSTLVDTASYSREARALGAIRLISRPIEPDALLRAVEGCLARSADGGQEGS